MTAPDPGPDVSRDDVRDALRMLRALSGGEPYAPHVYPTAKQIARIVAERTAEWKTKYIAARQSGYAEGRSELLTAIDKTWATAAREMEVVGPPYAERVLEHMRAALDAAIDRAEARALLEQLPGGET